MVTRRYFILASAALTVVPFILDEARADMPPFKLFDTHVHLFTDDVQHYPMHASERDVPRLTANPNTVDKVLKNMDENGVEGFVGVQYHGAYKTDNRYLLDSADAHKSRIVPVVILDAADPGSPDRLRDLATTRGVAGFRITGVDDKPGSFVWLDSAAAQNTWAVANELGLAIVIINDLQGIEERIAALAAKFPNTRLVLDHIGFLSAGISPDFGISGARAALKANPNVYYKVTPVNFRSFTTANIPATDFMRHLITVFGADHVMWGSDFGNSKGTYAELVTLSLNAAAQLTPVEKRKVFHDTGKSLFVRGGHGKA